MPYSFITYTRQGHVAYITLNRPAAGNAINVPMAQEIVDACLQVNQDDEVYVVVLAANGVAFCTGGELTGEPQCHPASALAAINRPVIAAINGDASGKGLELALSADIRLASDQAHFGMPQVGLGIIPDDGGTQRLPRIIGKGKAMEMLLTAESITAAEAVEIGLVNKIVPPSQLAAETEAIAVTMAAKGPVSLRYIKEAVHKGLDLTLEQGLRLEGDLYFILHTTSDRTEGIKAFLEKRPPGFKGK
ncbi:MAG: enoyl-CoA hydratase-related protein [Dehalococcoidales bacterium]|nr:enoyl-CoA hydratase-related protein [Dehalococcoidales bacterium]